MLGLKACDVFKTAEVVLEHMAEQVLMGARDLRGRPMSWGSPCTQFTTEEMERISWCLVNLIKM